MKTLAALIVALAATGVQAKEVFTIENPAQCAKAHEMLNADDSFKQLNIQGQRFYVKDRTFGHFSKPCTVTGKGELYTESFEEFKQRMSGVDLKESDVEWINQPTQLLATNKVAAPAVSFWDSGWGTAIKVVVLGAIIYKLSAPLAASGICDFDWQTAKDGSRCGKRSAASRPGGK
jgi:hypothetical protein